MKRILMVLTVVTVIFAVSRWTEKPRVTEQETSVAAESVSEPLKVTETEAAAIAETEAVPVDPEALREIDWEELKSLNPDIVAWVYIPDTKIDTPVVWSGDNEKYLYLGLNGKKSYETIFADGESTPDMSGRHCILYGHHMKNGKGFTDICRFKDEKFFEKHDRVYVYTPEKAFVLEPAACLYCDPEPVRRRTVFADDMELDTYLDEMTADCAFRKDVTDPEQVFSLTTCSYERENVRTILYCTPVQVVDLV